MIIFVCWKTPNYEEIAIVLNNTVQMLWLDVQHDNVSK